MMQQSLFHPGEQAFHSKLQITEVQEETSHRVIRKYLPQQHTDFYDGTTANPFLFVATVDANGQPWASPLIGERGFAKTIEPSLVEFSYQRIDGDIFNTLVGDVSLDVENGVYLGLLGIEFDTRRRNRMNGHVIKNDPTTSIMQVRVDQSFGNCPKYIQSRSWTYQAPTETTLVVSNLLTDETRKIIQNSDCFYIASAYLPADHPNNTDATFIGADLSHRGGKKGFVKVIDDNQLVFPDYLGNFLFNTLGNILKHPQCGLLFIDYQTGDILQVAGLGEVLFDERTMPGAQRMVSVKITEVRHVTKALPFDWKFLNESPVNPPLEEGSKSTIRMRCTEIAPASASGEAKSFVFRVPEYVAFQREPGQYATFYLVIDGKQFVRTWTISHGMKDATDGSLTITVKRKEGGVVSTWLHEQQPGFYVDILGIEGKFTIAKDLYTSEEQGLKMFIFAGGVGITPFYAMITEKLKRVNKIDIILLYSVRSLEDLIFPELLTIKAKTGVKVAVTLTGPAPANWNGLRGRLSQEMVLSLLPEGENILEREFYVCGPEIFMDSVKAMLKAMSVVPEQVHLEEFNF